ncbi:HAD family hydrolase [Salininema proteolyticum]|uniref:HAD family hydrolase n=1 Tax=Salininema proteolyticum TaxID=1607685 RepID=A0ABV8U1K7_9ACTN
MNDFPEALFWDMDGTLVDTEPLWDDATAAFLADHGVDHSDELRHQMVGAPGSVVIPLILQAAGLGPEHADQVRARIKAHVVTAFSAGVPLMPGAVGLLEEADAKGIPQVLVTSTSPDLTDILLESIGRRRFEHIVTPVDVDHPKPHPAPYRKAGELIGVPVTETLAIEDSASGIRSALAAGAGVIAVPSSAPLPEEHPLLRVRSLDHYRLADLPALAYRAPAV